MKPFPPPWGNYLLEGLAETNVPESISWLPTTIGWQIVYTLFVLFIIKRMYNAYKEYKRNAYRRDALKCLDSIQSNNLNPEQLRKLPALLRTVALHAYERQSITALTGEKWEQWLDQQSANSNFHGKCRGILQQLSFAKDINLEQQQISMLISEITTWVRSHRRLDA